MTATISDVALRSGVDEATVGRVLGAGLMDVGSGTIERILDSAEAAGFPRDRRTHLIGVLYAEESGRGLTHPYFVTILDALKREAEEGGYDILFINKQAVASGASYLEHCHIHALDGVCLVCVDFASPEVRALAAGDLPMVTLDHIYRGVPAVLSDNETGVQKLVEYAIRKGHRRIAFIHGHNNSVVTRTRIKQFYNTMAFHALPVPDEYVREGRYDEVGLTRKLVTELLNLPERPTCILLPDDIAYLGAQDAARDMGLSVPREISFVGYDGIPLIQTLRPRLTTIRQDGEQLGQALARLLIQAIEHPGNSRHMPTIFPVEFLEGGTVAEV